MDSEESQEEMRVADDYWRCVQSNSSFKKEDVYKYTWLRMAEGRVVDKALMDDVLLPRRMDFR